MKMLQVTQMSWKQLDDKAQGEERSNLTLDNMCTSYLRLSILRQVFQIEIIAKKINQSLIVL